MKNSFIFDFDGTLVASIQTKAEIMTNIFNHVNPNHIKDIYEYDIANKGKSRFEKIEYIIKNILKKDFIEHDLLEYYQKYSKLVVERLPFCPEINYAYEFLKNSYQKGINLYLVTATPDQDIYNILEKKGWNKYFKKVLGSTSGDKISNTKLLLEEFDILVTDAIYFGDSIEDYSSAEQNNIDFVLIGDSIKLKNTSNVIFGYKNYYEFINYNQYGMLL